MFQKNRERLAQKLENHLLVIAAHSALQYSADLAYPFRQDSNFWYLTGISEPDLVLLIDTSSAQTTLLLPTQNDYQKLWDGENKIELFKRQSGVSKFDTLDSLVNRLKKAKERKLTIGYLAPLPKIVEPYGFYANPSRRHIEAIIKSVETSPADIRGDIARLRQIKHPQEIDAIRGAIDITARSLKEVKSHLDTFENEKDIERALSRGFYTGDGDGHAFEPIIASGHNAATLHYNHNNAVVEKNALLLLDVGASCQGYAADISRVWSVGRPTKRQVVVYETLRDIQIKALTILKPGITLREFQLKVEEYAQKQQQKIGISNEGMPHGVSHYLGIDVHDAGDYSLPLTENMVITVEPGIYLPEEGIGVRIEDDVLIAKDGIVVLSEAISKDL